MSGEPARSHRVPALFKGYVGTRMVAHEAESKEATQLLCLGRDLVASVCLQYLTRREEL